MRDEPDPVAGHLVPIRQTIDAQVFLGAVCDNADRQVEFVDAGLSRTTVNHYMAHTLLLFKHGVRLEL